MERTQGTAAETTVGSMLTPEVVMYFRLQQQPGWGTKRISQRGRRRAQRRRGATCPQGAGRGLGQEAR